MAEVQSWTLPRDVAPTRPNYALFYFAHHCFLAVSIQLPTFEFPLVQLVDLMKLFLMKTCPGFDLHNPTDWTAAACFIKHLKLHICNTKSPLSCRVIRKPLKTGLFFFLFNLFILFFFFKAKTCESNEWTVPFHVASRCTAVSIPSTASPSCASFLVFFFSFVQLGFQEPHWHAGHVYEIYIYIYKYEFSRLFVAGETTATTVEVVDQVQRTGCKGMLCDLWICLINYFFFLNYIYICKFNLMWALRLHPLLQRMFVIWIFFFFAFFYPSLPAFVAF